MRNQPRFFIIMGVSGCGKSTVGKMLSDRLGWDFYDGDDFHPPANIAKMAADIPLDDVDRAPWLARLHDLIAQCLADRHPGVLACSALKQKYRQTLLAGNLDTQLVYLKGDYETILARLSSRHNHYMKAEMLKSQFADLEEPIDALVMDVRLAPEQIVENILSEAALG